MPILPVAFPVPKDFNDISKSWALFGEVGRQFLDDSLELAWGLRRFHDEVDTVVNSYWTGVDIPKQSFSFNATTQRFVLNWKANPDLTFYSSYSQGFRSGVGQDPFASAVVPNIPPLRPDKLNNYEIGAKGYLWDRLAMFDAAVFYMDWKQTQQMFVIPVSGNVFASALVNGAGASGPGAEFSISSQPIQDLDLNVNFSWNDLTFDQDVYSAGVLLFPKGQRLNDSVKYTAGASADYAFPLGGQGLQGGVSLSGNYSSKRAGVLLAGPDQEDELVSRLRQYAKAHPDDKVLFARANFYPEDGATTPSHELLDRAVSDRPLIVYDMSVHAVWLNAKALALAGVTLRPNANPMFEKGIVRNADGTPRGCFWRRPCSLLNGLRCSCCLGRPCYPYCARARDT